MHFIWLAMALALELDVSGTIRDSSGGVLAAAGIVAWTEAGGAEIARTIADESGRYRLSLPSGAYVLEAASPLFEKVSERVSADGPFVIDFALSPASLSETITVRSSLESEIL